MQPLLLKLAMPSRIERLRAEFIKIKAHIRHKIVTEVELERMRYINTTLLMLDPTWTFNDKNKLLMRSKVKN